MKHGTANGYQYHRCRCRACTDAATEQQRRLRANRSEIPDHVHGTANGYLNYGCRCARCGEANWLYRRAQRARQTATN